MPNFIRACFCINRLLDHQDLEILLEIMSKRECYALGEPQLLRCSWINQKLEWKKKDTFIEARLFQFSIPEMENPLFSFDVDEISFLPAGDISYEPHQDPLYIEYKILLINLIEQIKPIIGVIDYEADPLCGEISKSREIIAAWGNFFPFTTLVNWSLEDDNLLREIVDELIPIHDLGYLTFIHPLMVNQAWSNRHKQLEILIKSHL